MRFNPLDPELATDPFPILRQLREFDPVYEATELGAFVVTGHEPASRVLRRRDGDVRWNLYQRMRHGDGVVDEPYFQILAHSVLMKCGESHRRIRRAIGPNLSPAVVDPLRDDILCVANGLIDGFVGDGRVELMRTFADRLPMKSISMLLDLGEDVEENMHEWVEGFNLASQMLPLTPEQLARANASLIAIHGRFRDLVGERRGEPGDDVMSRLIAEADAGLITEDELIGNVWLLFVAAFDTTAMTIGNAIVALLQHPDQLARLRAEPSRMPAAVDELLRYVGPVHATHRLLESPIELGDKEIPADTPVMIYFSGANHDESWCPDAEQLDIDRASPGEHLAFGDGPHKCPGRHLARIMVAAALEALITRLEGMRLEELVWNQTALVFRGPERLVLAWDAG
jgi:cytochrome P450